MAENIQDYTVSIDFDTAIAKINKLQQITKNLNRAQVNGLTHQISLQRQLNALKGVGGGKQPTSPAVPTPKLPKEPAAASQKAKQIAKEEAALQKRIDDRIADRKKRARKKRRNFSTY